MLYRFREAKNAELGGSRYKERRPYRVSEVTSLVEAEKWRRNVIGDISKKVSKIQDGKPNTTKTLRLCRTFSNPQFDRETSRLTHLTVFHYNLKIAGLSDFQIRDLNDEINKLMREKYRWEQHIKELGGVDYRVRNRGRDLSSAWTAALSYGKPQLERRQLTPNFPSFNLGHWPKDIGCTGQGSARCPWIQIFRTSQGSARCQGAVPAQGPDPQGEEPRRAAAQCRCRLLWIQR